MIFRCEPLLTMTKASQNRHFLSNIKYCPCYIRMLAFYNSTSISTVNPALLCRIERCRWEFLAHIVEVEVTLQLTVSQSVSQSVSVSRYRAHTGTRSRSHFATECQSVSQSVCQSIEPTLGLEVEVTLRQSVSQSVSMSWYRVSMWDLRPDISSCWNVFFSCKFTIYSTNWAISKYVIRKHLCGAIIQRWFSYVYCTLLFFLSLAL
jgi:hypothetical protein